MTFENKKDFSSMANIFRAQYQEHHFDVTKEFMKWYENGIYVDVTIHADGQRIAAHKLVLAANSAFFNGVFRDEKNEHSNLYFTDVPFQSMKSLIEYMYSGDLKVERAFLPACLQLGDSLRVRGITDVHMDECITEPAPVSQKMHMIIDRLMEQGPFQQQQQPQQQEHQQQELQHQQEQQQMAQMHQEKHEHEQQQQQPAQIQQEQLTQQQLKKLKKLSRRTRKLMKRQALKAEKEAQAAQKRLQDTNEYKLEQFLQSLGSDGLFLENPLEMTLTEGQKTMDQIENGGVYDYNANFVPQQNNDYSTLSAAGTADEKKYYNSAAEEHDSFSHNHSPSDYLNHDLLNYENIGELRDDRCHEVNERISDHDHDLDHGLDHDHEHNCNHIQQHSNTHLENDVLAREGGGGVDSSISIREQRSEPNGAQGATAKIESPSYTPPYKSEKYAPKAAGNKRLKKSSDASKSTRKMKGKKRPLKFPPIKQELETEKLFDKTLLGADNKENLMIKNEVKCLTSSSLKERLKETENLERLRAAQVIEANRQHKQQQRAAQIKKAGPRRRNPMCPPPENILKNGKPSFSCGLCQRVYTHKSNYRRHYMVFHKRHAEAVFQCPMCKKKFTRSDNRTHHIRRIHGYTNTASLLSEDRALYYCPICKKAFIRSYNRAFHLVEEHGITTRSLQDK